MVSSTFFLAVILAGGAAVVVGATGYTRAKAAEDKAALQKAADAILDPEILANIDFAKGLKAALAQEKTPINNFETAAWETAGRGGLISAYAPAKSIRIIGFYNNVYRATANLSQLQNYTFGEGSMRSNRQDMMKAYRAVLGLATDEILKGVAPPVEVVPVRGTTRPAVKPAAAG